MALTRAEWKLVLGETAIIIFKWQQVLDRECFDRRRQGGLGKGRRRRQSWRICGGKRRARISGANDIEGKFSLRMSRTSECWLENCRIPMANRLPNASGLRAPLSCLSQARIGIAWGVIGAAIDCYETALAYAKSREQFDRPIAGFQLVQEKLVWMVAGNYQGSTAGLASHPNDGSRFGSPEQISLAKRNNVWMALECARKARDLLGAVGITDRYSVIRHLMNLEAVSTYEGTHDIHTLAIGRDITGISAFGG